MRVPRRFAVVFLGVLGACREEIGGPFQNIAPSASASSSASARVPAGPNSSGVWNADPRTLDCLRRGLPKSFSREDYPKVDATLSRCQPTEWKDKVFGFRFGRDAATGLELEVHGPFIAYADVKSETECLCLGGEPMHSVPEQVRYPDCVPPRSARETRWTRGSSYTLEKEAYWEDDRLHLTVRSDAMGALGIPHGATLLSIDGRPVKDPKEVERVFARFIEHPPAVLRLRTVQNKGEELDMHYVSRAVYSGLWSGMKDIRREHRDPGACDPAVIVERTRICARSVAATPPIAAWAALLAKLEKLARNPKPVVEKPWERTPEACRAVAELPSSIGFQRGDRHVEFRYVGWAF